MSFPHCAEISPVSQTRSIARVPPNQRERTHKLQHKPISKCVHVVVEKSSTRSLFRRDRESLTARTIRLLLLLYWTDRQTARDEHHPGLSMAASCSSSTRSLARWPRTGTELLVRVHLAFTMWSPLFNSHLSPSQKTTGTWLHFLIFELGQSPILVATAAAIGEEFRASSIVIAKARVSAHSMPPRKQMREGGPGAFRAHKLAFPWNAMARRHLIHDSCFFQQV